MLKLFYEGWTQPILVGEIEKLGITTPGDFLKFENSWQGSTYFSFGSNEDISTTFINEPSGFGGEGGFLKTVTWETDHELFTDPQLKVSTGLTCRLEKTNGLIKFKLKATGDILWTGHMVSGVERGETQLVSIHRGVSYIDFLKSIARFEQNTLKSGVDVEYLPMNMSPITAPFVTYTKKTYPVRVNQYTWVFTGGSPYLSFATLFKAFTGKQVVVTDLMNGTILGYPVENAAPCVRYDPRCIDVDSITVDGCPYNYEQSAQYFAVSTFKEPLYASQESTSSIDKLPLSNVAMFCSPFIQIGDVIAPGSPSGYSRTNVSLFEGTAGAFTLKPTVDNWRFLSKSEYGQTRHVYIIQNFSYWNVTKHLHDNGSTNMGEIPVGVEGIFIPLFNVMWSRGIFSKDDPHQEFNTLGFQCFAHGGAFSNNTGSDYLKWLFNNEWVDGGTEPKPPDDIPEDNGNGGFNDSDYIGGNGSWSDTTTDMSYDKNNDMWYTPDNLGLDGNYDIVKLDRTAVASLASQTWTQDGWLSYMAKMSNISRAGDGIANIKTCLADIPATKSAQIVAIAGFSIKEPIPCQRVNEHQQFDMGSVYVEKYFDSFLDYAPYTEIVLELPFAQPVTLAPETVVGHTINLTLSVDLVSDSALYIITANERLLAQVPANIFINIPFASSEYSQSAISALSGYIAGAGNIGNNRVASSAVSGALHGQNPVSAGATAVSRMLTSASGASVAGAMVKGIQVANKGVHEVASRGESRNITQISQGGGGGAIGVMGVKKAVLKITRPYVTIPPKYYELNGCPSGFVKTIGDCKGYLEVSAIYGNIPCNAEEFSIITEVLAGGVFP